MACLCLAGAAQGASKSGYSLVAGRILDFQALGPPPCDPEELCLDWIYRFRISAETLSGPRVPSPLTTELMVHGPPSRNIHVVLLVRRAGRGEPWIAQAVTSARPGDRACVEAALLQGVDLAPPRGARRKGDRLCFTV
ncbi:MAG TPA: hypothetical protein VFQ67_14035 [Allosphingosinicella sp.]|jgi:hypothetical protein|nr:hypothetical protein [Allosphingosinicella sp.]